MPQMKHQLNQFSRSLQVNRSQNMTSGNNNNNYNKMNRSLNRSFTNGNDKNKLNSSLERYHKIMKIGSNSPVLNSSLTHMDAPPFYSNPPTYDMTSSINPNQQFESNNSFNQFNPMPNNTFMNYQGPTPTPPPPMTPDLANSHIPFANDFSSPMFNSSMFNNKPNFQRMVPNNNFAMNNSLMMNKTPNFYPSNYSMNQPPNHNNNNNNTYHKQNYVNNYRPNKKPNRNSFNSYNRLDNAIDQEEGEIME
jgi:hypothetical protein